MRVYTATGPSCTNGIVTLQVCEAAPSGGWGRLKSEQLVFPLSGGRAPAPPQVPAEISADFTEACLVLRVSAKASAALSRRCMQAVLRDKGMTTAKDLYEQIEEVLAKVPSYLAENLHAVRTIGNFAAHPYKSKSTGCILDVEPGEAEWNIDVLEDLFDFYYVQPELAKRKRESLNSKLTEAGRRPLDG
jgi:hypothetical protein